MPHPKCSICLHDDVQVIDEALQRGQPPLRELAKQAGVTHSALYRHKRHTVFVKQLVINDIKAEISKLRYAQTAAKKRRDMTTVLAISREIRNWKALEAKTRPISPTDGANADDALSMRDALIVAKGLIESQLSDPDVRAWLESLVQVRAAGNVPDAQT